MLRNMFCAILIFTVLGDARVQSQNITETETYKSSTDSVTLVSDSIQKRKNFVDKVLNYFKDSNVEKDEKRFDVSFIGGPHYSSDSKLGLGVVASGLYRMDREDKSYSPSNISLYGDITTTGFYVIGISNNTIFPKEKYRIDLVTYFASQPSRYWGVGYKSARKDEYTKYTGKEISFKMDLLKKVLPKTFLGVTTDFKNMNGSKIQDISYLNGEERVSSYFGAGLSFSYDSRDFIPNPYKGIYAKAEYLIYPKFIGNRNTLSKYEITFRAYKQVWDGGVLAFDTQGIFNQGSTPWNMMVLTGSSRRMRGYYEGRYRDKMFMEAQVELRQHVWKRNGIAVWAGAGNVFPKFSQFEWDQTLPTVGVGYRWEFKNRVNVRLDYGVGKGESAFYFNINEAF